MAEVLAQIRATEVVIGVLERCVINLHRGVGHFGREERPGVRSPDDWHPCRLLGGHPDAWHVLERTGRGRTRKRGARIRRGRPDAEIRCLVVVHVLLPAKAGGTREAEVTRSGDVNKVDIIGRVQGPAFP